MLTNSRVKSCNVENEKNILQRILKYKLKKNFILPYLLNESYGLRTGAFRGTDCQFVITR